MTSPTSVSPLQDDVGLRGPLLFAVAGLLVFGLMYSVAGATLGRLAFSVQAGGSTIERDGRVVGSRWLAQPFADARYFRARPSAADYDPMAAGGSNLARSNPELAARVEALRAEVGAREGIAADAVPIELVTRSGGGLDPHVTP
ncbi:MAG TPA: potassium-transporting ATPase subunit C, partial [Lysobacter sp.]